MKLALSSEPTEEIKEGQVLLQNRGLFLRAGAGLALYQNNRPGESNGSGWSWTAGVGYEIPLTENFALAPIVDYAAGSLGDVRNIITVETGRHYSVVEFKAAIIWHFGKPN